MRNEHKWGQALYGLAYGDAWGYPNEFKTLDRIIRDSGKVGADFPTKAIVTDDTQMALALADALHDARFCEPMFIRRCIIERFTEWFRDPDNNRAPGATCMTALGRINKGWAWSIASNTESDGCGANMRVAPAAFLPDELWRPVAAFQAAITHGSPTAVAASLLTADVIRAAADGVVEAGGLLDFAASEAVFWDEWVPAEALDGWLNPLIPDDKLEGFLAEGFTHTIGAIKRAMHGLKPLKERPWQDDPSEWGGAGWRAHEALATALLCVDVFPGQPVQAVRRATVTGGDSDSLAAIAGAVAGALYDDPWPWQWALHLEPRYAAALEEADVRGVWKK